MVKINHIQMLLKITLDSTNNRSNFKYRVKYQTDHVKSFTVDTMSYMQTNMWLRLLRSAF